MNYTGNESDIGVYNIGVYVTDMGINNTHQNITDFCGQNGSNITSNMNYKIPYLRKRNNLSNARFFFSTLFS